MFKPAAFAEKQNCLRRNSVEQVHHRGRACAAHAEVNNSDASGGGVGHGTICAAHGNFIPLGEEAHVVAEVDQEDVFAEILECRAGVTRQPVGNDLVFRFHCADGFPQKRSACKPEEGFGLAVPNLPVGTSRGSASPPTLSQSQVITGG